MGLFFISYAKSDGKTFAQQLKRKIQKAGITVWLDDEDIDTGEEWWNVINETIKLSLGMIVVITPGALESHYVTYECSTARALQKAMLPLLVVDIDADIKARHPMFTMQYRDFTTPTAQDWEALIRSLREIQDQLNVHPTVEAAERALLNSYRLEDWESAVYTLEACEHPSAIEALARQVNSANPEVSKRAAMALARKSKFKDTRAVPGLAKAADRNSPTNERCKAIDAIGAISGPEAVRELLDLFEVDFAKEGHNIEYQSSMIRALGKNRVTAAIEKIASFIADPYLRAEAIISLCEMRDSRVIPFLSEELYKLIRRYYDLGPSLFMNSQGEIKVSSLSLNAQQQRNEIHKLVIGIIAALAEIGDENAFEVLKEARQIVEAGATFEVEIAEVIGKIENELNQS